MAGINPPSSAASTVWHALHSGSALLRRPRAFTEVFSFVCCRLHGVRDGMSETSMPSSQVEA